MASASITYCCRRRPPTGWSTPASPAACAHGTSRPITCRPMWIWISRGVSRRLLAPGFHPALEIDQRQRALVFGRLLEGAVVEPVDPGLIGGGAVLGVVLSEGEPHQPARRLARHVVAGKQHGAQHGLRLALALLRREPEPARRLARVVRRAIAVEIEPRQIILRFGIAEI